MSRLCGFCPGTNPHNPQGLDDPQDPDIWGATGFLALCRRNPAANMPNQALFLHGWRDEGITERL